jgi:hypothetical protein
MILITTYYTTVNKDRNNEINKCLKKNFENKYIKKIYLLNNSNYNIDFIDNNKSKIIQIIISNDINYKLKYNDAILFINEYLNNEICILSNSDIYFNETLMLINNQNIINNFFALLRYDEDENENLTIFKRHDIPRDDSQDCWIFKSPLNVDLDKLNFSLGTLGCDSIFASIVNDSGIKLSNPSLDIVSIHVHNTEFRTYSDVNRIHGKYCIIPTCKINEYKEITIIDY